MALSDLHKLTAKRNKANDGTRTLFESTMMPASISALRDWSQVRAAGVLIGGLALSYHARPRMTQDLDFLFLSASDVPDQVPGFGRDGPNAFRHDGTHVEVKIVTSDLIGVPRTVVEKVIDTATESDGIHVATAAGLIALKLYRLSMQDKADIVALIKSGRASGLPEFLLPADKTADFEGLVDAARTDLHPG
jgi:hypothetical protein